MRDAAASGVECSGAARPPSLLWLARARRPTRLSWSRRCVASRAPSESQLPTVCLAFSAELGTIYLFLSVRFLCLISHLPLSLILLAHATRIHPPPATSPPSSCHASPCCCFLVSTCLRMLTPLKSSFVSILVSADVLRPVRPSHTHPNARCRSRSRSLVRRLNRTFVSSRPFTVPF